MASPKSTLYAVMLVSLLGTAGIALPYPVLSPFFLDSGADNALTQFMGLPPKVLLGIILALYPLGSLLGSSFIGAISDIYGRKRVLVISLILAAAGYGLTGYAVSIENYPLFALARLLTGICEGNVAISRAIALELHPAISRTRAISLLYATTYAGWLVGPLAGGYLMVFGVANVFLITGGVTLLATLLVQVAIIRADGVGHDGAGVLEIIASNNSIGLLKLVDLRPLILYHFLFTLGLNAFYEFYPLWLVERFQFDSVSIGWGTVVITLSMIISSIYLLSPIENRLGALGTVQVGSGLLGCLFLLLPLAGPVGLYPVFLAIGAVIAVANGVFPVYMANRFESYGHGRVQGLLTTNFYAANVIAALVGSVIALLGTGWSLAAGGVLCILASAWLYKGVRPHATAIQ
jgi:predicted MFS family arabinose efflux permease